MGRKAIGIVRVSQVGGREGESFASPAEQTDRIRAACERDGLTLIQTIDELDVSGGTPLEDREGLRSAIEAVEAGEAEVIVAAYFDRLVRSLRVQDELVSRVERAGGQVLALDVGAVSGGSAGQWLSATMLGAVAEYHRRSVRERSAEAQARAVARGVAPWPKIPFGYVRGEDGVLVPSEDAPAVLEAFQMRLEGTPIRVIHERLGIPYTAVQRMLSNRVYLGEILFGRLANLEAHEPLVPRELWQRVQTIRVPRGPRPKSERLLARLGILRCGGCDGRMGVSTSYNGRYPIYRCPRWSPGGCSVRATIGAEIAEDVVVNATREAIADMEGRASAARDAQEAEAAAERAQGELDAAIAAFQGLEAEPAAVEKLRGLREARDVAREEAHRLSRLSSAITVSGADWELANLAERRALIRTVVERAIVGPGRGASRVTVHLFGEDASGHAVEDAGDL